ncbi:MAG: hypothetical protein ABR508_05855 [Candidatus Baltobacteraceae bacterium]
MVSARLLLKRWPLYAATLAGGIAIQMVLLQFVRGSPQTWSFVQLIAAPLVNAIVLVNVGADAAGVLPANGARLERLLERAWAIILIDAALTISLAVALDTMNKGDAGARLMALMVVFMQTMLIYAEPYAALDEHVSAIALIPFALLRSMMLSWVNIVRICTMFVLQLAVITGSYLLILAMHGSAAPLVEYANIVYGTAATAALSALYAVAYLDTLSQERASAP